VDSKPSFLFKLNVAHLQSHDFHALFMGFGTLHLDLLGRQVGCVVGGYYLVNFQVHERLGAHDCRKE
jgi:hypothetical protein